MFHSDQKSRGPSTSESKIAGQVHFILETWDFHQSTTQEYTLQPKYQFIWNKGLQLVIKEVDTIWLQRSQ